MQKAWRFIESLSARARETALVFLITFCATLIFALTPFYSVAELKFYDFRLKENISRIATDEIPVMLLSRRDSSVEAGWNDERTLKLLQRLQDLGVRVVILGDEVFDKQDTTFQQLPSDFIVVRERPDGLRESEFQSRLLFREQTELDSLEDTDGVLRRLPKDHPAVAFWARLLGPNLPNKPDIISLIPEHRKNRSGGATVSSSITLEELNASLESFALGSHGSEQLKAHFAGKTIVLERETTAANANREITTSVGHSTPGQLQLSIANTLLSDWSPIEVPTPLAIIILGFGILVYVQALGGRHPVTVAIVSVFTLAVTALASSELLAIGYNAPAVLGLVALFVASLSLVLTEIYQGRKFLKSFGGSEHAKFEGRESTASMVFTNLPSHLLKMERRHDRNLLLYRRQYNEILAKTAKRYHGKVLDFQGDAQMLGFGLRYDEDTEHAAEATAAALEIVEEVAKLTQLWQVDEDSTRVHVGVCTGPIALGHLGAIQKQDIAAIGDTTNTAARLMGAAIKSKVGVMVSQPTVETAQGAIQGRPLPPVALKGKSAPVEVFEAESVDPEWRERNAKKNKENSPTGGVLEFRGKQQDSILISIMLASLGFLFAVGVLRNDRHLEKLEQRAQDIVHKIFCLAPGDPNIVLIGIDDASVNDPALKGFPFSRGVYAQVLDNLRNSGCKGIFVDVLFRKPGSKDPAGDLHLADTVKAEPKIVLAGTLTQNAQARWEEPYLFPAANFPLLKARNQIGLIHNFSDKDGMTRGGYLCLSETASHDSAEAEERSTFPSAALALLLGPEDELKVESDTVVAGTHLIDADTDKQGWAAIRLRFGPPATGQAETSSKKAYEVVSFRRLIHPSDPIFKELSGKYVMIGQTGDNDVDQVDTIVGKIKGVEVHARVLDNLLNKNFFQEVFPPLQAMLLSLCTIIPVFVLVRYREPRRSLALLLALLVVVLTGFVAAMSVFSVIFEVTLLLAVIILITSTVLLGRNVFTFQALTRVVPKEVAAELLFKHNSRDRRQVATILLTDIRGFTTLAEGRSAVAVLDILNEYHKRTVACYARHGGQALTYQGDAQIVVFGVFGDRANPASDAVEAALGLQAICDELRAEWGIENREDFDVGAGLCTGEVEVGLLGGGKNLQYTVVGETVRKAHKVQSLSDELSAPVIMDEETYQAAGEQIEVDDLGTVQPKGIPTEIRLYRANSVQKPGLTSRKKNQP